MRIEASAFRFAASSRLFDLNGEANSVRKKHSSATIIVDVKRFAHQINTDEVFGTHNRAGLELAPGRAGAARQTLQEAHAFSIKAAKGLLLHAPGNHSPQQVLAQTTRGRSPEHRPPTPPNCFPAMDRCQAA